MKTKHISISRAARLALLAVLLAIVPSTSALAFELRGGESTVVEAGSTVNDDLYAFGNTVDIRGTVNGDVITSAGTVTVSGIVTGDLIAAGGTVAVPGQVRGSVRAAGGNLSIGGTVGDDVLVGGGSLEIGSTARIGRDLLFGGGTATIDGRVERNVQVGAGDLTLSGQVGGDVSARVERLTVADRATIDGDLRYGASQTATIAPGATIGGETERTATPEQAQPTTADRLISAMVGWLRTLVGMLLVGLTLVLLFPAFSRRAAGSIRAAPWPSVGVGVALLVAVPILALVVFIAGLFIGGWWLAPMLLGAYALVLGYVVAALFVGRSALERSGRANLHPAVLVTAGLAPLLLVGAIPIVGWIIGVAAAIVGLGALARTVWLTRRPERTAAPV